MVNIMSLLYELLNEKAWEEFFEYKTSKNNITEREKNELNEYIYNKVYKNIAEKVLSCDEFPIPQMKKINKKNTMKKRVVFTFDSGENYLLKMLSFLLYKYDCLFSDNLYSFRRDKGVKHAVRKLSSYPKVSGMFSYKVDIHDYFNSVDTKLMTDIINRKLSDDTMLCGFLNSLLENPYAEAEGEVVKCRKGIMAGVPVSGFLANLYLADMDEWFLKNNILYARYSDDIIVFADSKEKIELYENKIKEFLSQYKLEINPKKEVRTNAGEKWDFLGFSFENGVIDISEVASDKLKAKMKRKAKALTRWKKRNNASDERAIKAFIRHFNKKLYDNPIHNDITWCRWYFPVINTHKTLKDIDDYAISCIRYIRTGKYTKANYNLRYEKIKECGFKSLVNEFYKLKIEN